MIKINFSQEAIKALHYERMNHPHPRVRQKMEALYLKSQGFSHKTICRIVRISKATLVSYLKAYLEGGIEELKEVSFYKPQSLLDNHIPMLKAYFQKHPPFSVAEAQSKIGELTDIHRSPTQIRQFLKRIGMSPRKVGSVPGKVVNEEKIQEQESFKEQHLQPRLKEAKEGKRVVFFY